MITATFERNSDETILSFEITGHAGFGHMGEDIVCAAVSALAYSTLNSVDRLAQFQPKVEIDEVEGGYMRAEFLTDTNQKQSEVTQILLESLLIGFQTICESYSEYIQIEILTK